MIPMTNKIALVTGAGSGIGRAASLALQEQTNGKEPEIRHTDPVGGVLQRFFQLDADAQLVHYLLKLGADRRPNLMSYEFDCLGCG